MILQSIMVNHNGNAQLASVALPQYEQRMRVLELTVQLLIARISMGDYWIEGFRDVGKLLARLSIPRDEFESATRHLQNAISYCEENEFGAATFELRALRGHLQRH